MGDEAERFRLRANECREIAAATADEGWRATLLGIAEDFEEEAARLDAEEQRSR